MPEDFTLSLQAVIHILLTEMKACGTVMLRRRFKRLHETLHKWQNISPPPSPPSPLLCPRPKWGQDDNDSTGSQSALPLLHDEWKWNWFENPPPARAGTEGIIVLIVLILRPSPPPPLQTNSTHHAPFSSLCDSIYVGTLWSSLSSFSFIL